MENPLFAIWNGFPEHFKDFYKKPDDPKTWLMKFMCEKLFEKGYRQISKKEIAEFLGKTFGMSPSGVRYIIDYLKLKGFLIPAGRGIYRIEIPPEYQKYVSEDESKT